MNNTEVWYEIIDHHKKYYDLMSFYIPLKMDDKKVFFNVVDIKMVEKLLIRFASKRDEIILRLLNHKQRKQKLERVLYGGIN